MEQVHGHDVIAMLKTYSKESSKEQLIEAVQKKFGEECRFYNCSNDNMTALELLSFFEGKGKIQFSDTGYSFGAVGCKH